MEGIHGKIPNSTIVVIDKAGHNSPLEKAPEVNQNIIDYLSEGLYLGHEIEALRQKLLESGYTESQINEAINYVNSVTNPHYESHQSKPDMENSKKSSKKIWFLAGILCLVIILVVGYFIFQPFSSDSNSDSSSENSQLVGETQVQSKEVIDCGQTPPNFAKDTGEEYEIYFIDHPEAKESLECISGGFNSCVPSKITYLNNNTDTIFIVNRSEGDNCIIQLIYGDKAIECEYTSEQIAMVRSITEKQLEPWWDAYGISLSLGFEVLKYSPGETIDAGIYNSETGETSPVPCIFYSPDNS